MIKLKGFAAGGVDYITKPFQKEEVLARIRAHLTIRNLQKDLEDKVWELKVLYEQVKDLSIRGFPDGSVQPSLPG
jgi:DNA-binding response OmpR family regulator